MSFWGWIKNALANKKVMPDLPDREPVPVTGPVEIPAFDPIPKQSKYSHLDPTHLVPRLPLQLALDYFDAHQDKFPNKNYITVVDYSKHSSKLRFFVIEMLSGKVEAHACAHGKNSDPDNDGYATLFSNTPGSNQSTLGFVKTSSIYDGKHPHSLHLVGLSPSNSNMFDRYIVVHESDYVRDGASQQGRSLGCPALDKRYARKVIDKISFGSLMLLWHPKFEA